MNEGPFCV